MKRKLIFALGNPGKEYAKTYHNVGALALAALAEKEEDLSPWKVSPRGSFEYAKGRAGARIFVKPLTFMNESGYALRETLRFFKAKKEDLVVIHDESDLPLGTVRLARVSGPAGHRGVSSLLAELGTNEVARIRIGIRRESTRPIPAKRIVLRTISKTDENTLYSIFEEVGAMIEKVIANEQV